MIEMRKLNWKLLAWTWIKCRPFIVSDIITKFQCCWSLGRVVTLFCQHLKFSMFQNICSELGPMMT
jgi:hypothetical protein